MKYLAFQLARLYPRAWRARYGREFDAFLEDVDLNWLDLLNLLFGALRAHLEGDKHVAGGPAKLPRLLEIEHREIPHGHEWETVMEYTQPDGGTVLDRRFLREIDLGGAYVFLNHGARGAGPAQTTIVYGKKGEVDGDFRNDRTQMLILKPDGTVERTEQTVKTWLKGEGIRRRLIENYRNQRKVGLSWDEIFQKMRQQDHPPAPSAHEPD
jgi:hypothetical protein